MDLINKSIIICSIVRDAEKGLKRNIPVIDRFCNAFGTISWRFTGWRLYVGVAMK